METKTFEWLEAKTDDTSGLVSGYGSTYNADLVGDKILPGAFAQSIKDKRGKVPLLMNHMSDAISGWTTELSEDGKGLFVTGKLFLSTATGRDAHGLLKDAAAADVRIGMSIGFIAKEVDFEESYRIIKEIDLWEISFTPFPAQPKAFVSDVKTQREFEQYLRDAGHYSLAEAKRIVSLVTACGRSANGMSSDSDRNARWFNALKGIQ